MQAWESISSGKHTLVIAPTGSGKTLAAFLWALDRLAAAPRPKTQRAAAACCMSHRSRRLLWTSSVTCARRWPASARRPTASGVPEPSIKVAVRSGDTAADERRRLAGSPPDILITTPESLFLLLTSRARETLHSVQTVIVDEVHALAGNKRGAHLALSLERLDALRIPNGCAGGGSLDVQAPAQRTPPKLPLEHMRDGQEHPRQPVPQASTSRPNKSTGRSRHSASGFPRPYARLRRSPRSSAGDRPVTIAAPPHEKRLELEIVVPVEDMTELGPGRHSGPPAGAPDPDLAAPGRAGHRAHRLLAHRRRPFRPGLPTSGWAAPADLASPTPAWLIPALDTGQRSIWPHVEARVLDLIEGHRSTIVFANSRRLSERLCAALNELAYERAWRPRRP